MKEALKLIKRVKLVKWFLEGLGKACKDNFMMNLFVLNKRLRLMSNNLLIGDTIKNNTKMQTTVIHYKCKMTLSKNNINLIKNRFNTLGRENLKIKFLIFNLINSI